MRLSFPEPIISALPIVRRLREHHFEAVFVGGAVRDTVLGLPIKDVDIATSARPEQVLELFERCIPTGLQHGTITVIQADITYEVTTFRQESAYESHRKPESVLYITELDGDLLRRDFTMNAMALAEDGVLYDPYGGIYDLQNKTLRSVGDPDARFQEDALRMLRAVRFIGVYGLTPAIRTWRAILRHRHLLKFIAMERVQVELDKMLAGAAPQRALHYAAASGLLFHIKETLLAETAFALKEADRTAEAKRLFNRLHELQSVDLRWAALAIGLHLSIDATRQALQVLRFSNTRSKVITTIIEIHKAMLGISEQVNDRELRAGWLEVIIRFGKHHASDWLEIMRKLETVPQTFSEGLLNDLMSWLEDIPVSTLKQLKISGRDLTNQLQREAGPWVSEYLGRLLLMAALEQLDNNKAALLAQAALWNKERD
ncbi:CCA tRNA nucleotidyltransferase [Paenibacillus sp. PL91]|uniref:CCA tRNA nucleotidyltransferase n=1 Tax=Paenibacillus sp. PL91 TaxID=2729538 RepID=UPI00145D39F5|nr:CCA tRNA nucleotidyltransferase [Paenibacillus sp. PL91]MBC9198839.1 CCA tRNA nucleotidyltransferase [Paenibacillus sp. PL91]